MSEDTSPRRAVVLGGSGAVGSEIVRQLAARGVTSDFTFHGNEPLAAALAVETGSRAHGVDFRDASVVARWLDSFTGEPPSVLVHAAGVLGPRSLGEADAEALDAMYAVNVRAPLLALRALLPGMTRRGGGDVVFIGALDRSQSLPIPAPFAATQAALSGAAMALAHEVGRSGIRVNLLASGLLDSGLGTRVEESLRRTYLAYSALRRFGSPREIARVAVWLALDERAMTGKVVPVHGGI